jgi:hypothetical protein
MYQRLPSPSSIRLLRIEPGIADDDIRLEVDIHDLNTSPPFQALSYVWGEKDPPTRVFVNGVPKDIGPNLASALKRLRPFPKSASRLYKQLPQDDFLNSSQHAWSEFAHHVDELSFEERSLQQFIWIDALAIDQDNLREREQQVSMMREIYQKAAKVIVWLGEDQVYERAPRIVNKLAWRTHLGEFGEMPIVLSFFAQTQRATVLEDTEDWNPAIYGEGQVVNRFFGFLPTSAPEWGALRRFFLRPWFSRVWVLQEIAVAQSACFMVGGWNVEWNAVANAAVFFQDKNYSSLVDTAAAAHAARVSREKSLTPLIDLLRDARQRLATDPRDKVFALLGLAEEHPLFETTTDQRIRPDYRKTRLETFRDVTAFIIENSGNLDIFSDIDHNRSTDDDLFPSWTPCWDLPSITREQLTYAATYNTSNGRQPKMQSHPDPNVLSLEGMRMDTVQASEGTTAGSLTVSGTARLRDAWSMVKTALEHVSRAGMTTHLYFIQFILAATAGSTESGMGNHISLMQRLADIRDDNVASTLPTRAERVMSFFKPLIDPSEYFSSRVSLDEFRLFVEEKCAGRILFVTKSGFIGLGPASMLPGDIVVVLFGGRVPYIVRKRSVPSSSSSGLIHATETHYTFVGESYIFGVMEGEALLDIEEPETLFETFYLR